MSEFDKWAAKKYPNASRKDSLGAFSRDLMKSAREGWDAHAELAALKAGQGEAVAPYGYLREVDGNVQLSVGPARPADRSGGCATPWSAIFAAPAASADAVPVPLTREAIHLAFEHKLRAVNQPHYGERRGDWRTLNREDMADVVLELLAAPSTKKESGDE